MVITDFTLVHLERLALTTDIHSFAFVHQKLGVRTALWWFPDHIENRDFKILKIDTDQKSRDWR